MVGLLIGRSIKISKEGGIFALFHPINVILLGQLVSLVYFINNGIRFRQCPYTIFQNIGNKDMDNLYMYALPKLRILIYNFARLGAASKKGVLFGGAHHKVAILTLPQQNYH